MPKSFLIFWQIAKISTTVYSSMTTLFIVKFVSDRMKNGEGVVFEIFAAIGSHVNENDNKSFEKNI